MKMCEAVRSGQILVKAPFIIIVFLGCAAFAVDIGFWHLRRAQAQSAAEATALSAAYRASGGFSPSSQPSTFAEAQQNSQSLAPANAPGCQMPPLYEWGTWSQGYGFRVPSTSVLRSALRVTVRADQPGFFGQFFGHHTRTLSGQATVVWTPYGDVWPMAISSTTDFSPGRRFQIGPGRANNAPGNKGWVAFNGETNTVALETYLNGGPYSAGRPSPWACLSGLNQTTTSAYDLNNGDSGASLTVSGAVGLHHALHEDVLAQVNAGAVVLIPIWDECSGPGANAEYKLCGVVPVQLVPPCDDIDEINVRILSDGAYWFPPDTNAVDYVRSRIKPYLDVTMVE